MDSNQYSPKFTNSSSCWNIEKMDISHVHMLQNQIASSFDRSLWPNYPTQTHQIPSSSSSSSSNQNMPSSSLLGDMLAHFEEDEEPEEELGAMKEMMYKIAAMQPVDIDPATIRKPKRRNVRISDDPQSVAARHRRERISEKIRILQRLVPGGTKMDTASMLDEAVRYVKFLKRQIRLLQSNQLHPQPQQQSSLGIGINDNHVTTAAAGCLSTPPDHWPFAPHSKPNSAPTNSPSVQETMVAVGAGYSIGGHAASGALQGFNHEVISD